MLDVFLWRFELEMLEEGQSLMCMDELRVSYPCREDCGTVGDKFLGLRKHMMFGCCFRMHSSTEKTLQLLMRRIDDIFQ